MPSESTINLEMDREELIRVVKLAALFARRTVNGTIICETKAPDTFSVHSVASELGENDSTITVPVTTEDKVTLSSRYLLDALNAFDEPKIRFGFSGRTSPILLRNPGSEDYAHAVTPINI